MGNTFGNLPSPSTGAMLEGFEIIAKRGLRIALHAETASIMAWREKRLQAAGRNDPLAHLASRPAVVAVEAVSRAAVLAEWTGARIHILHISSADELRPLREAKARGVDITGETCPHYLLFDERAYEDHRSIIRVNPPVREKRHQLGLWEGLRDGIIDLIATDHARTPRPRNCATTSGAPIAVSRSGDADAADADAGAGRAFVAQRLCAPDIDEPRQDLRALSGKGRADAGLRRGHYPRRSRS